MTRNGLTYKEMADFFRADVKPDILRLETKMDAIQNQLNNQKLLAAVVGGFMSIITTILLGWNPLKKS